MWGRQTRNARNEAAVVSGAPQFVLIGRWKLESDAVTGNLRVSVLRDGQFYPQMVVVG